MSITNITINGADGSTVDELGEVLRSLETGGRGGINSGTSVKDSDRPVSDDVLMRFIDGAFSDENKQFDGTELDGLKALIDHFGSDAASRADSPTRKPRDRGETESPTDGKDSSSSSELTPQEFMSKLNDIALRTGKDFGADEEKLLDLGKKLINATPEQQQAFLDKAESYMGDGDLKQVGVLLEAFADGLLDKSSESSTNDESSVEKKSFMDKVEDLLAESQEGKKGPGEIMAREAAELLEDNPKVDQDAFLKELDKLLNNEDQNGDYKKDIDETNGREGTVLKKMAEAFKDLPSDRGDESSVDSSDYDYSGVISAYLKDIDSDGDIDPKELAGLKRLLDATMNPDSLVATST